MKIFLRLANSNHFKSENITNAYKLHMTTIYKNFFSFWLHWVFVAARRLSLVAASRGATLRCGVQASHYGGFSCCGSRAPGMRASVVLAHGLSSCGSQALEHRLSSCGAQA